MTKKITQKEFDDRLYKIYNGEYISDGNFIKCSEYTKIIHVSCGTKFDVYPPNILNSKTKCPFCFGKSKRISDEVFKRKFYDLVGDEYTLLEPYKGANKKIKIRHNNCSCKNGYYEWSITPHSFFDSNSRCPYESHQNQYTVDVVKQRLKKYFPNYLLIDGNYTNSSGKFIIQCDKGHSFYKSLDQITKQSGCPYCNNSKILKGYNDLNTLFPDIAKHLLNYEEGYSIAYYTRKKYDFKCPDCGKIHHKMPRLVLNKFGNFICSCKDNISYPEKFFMSILNQLNINYIYQLNKSDFSWCDKYKYDFYLNDLNLIVEINGMQHYKDTTWGSFKEVSDNDKSKQKLALLNNIHVISIDARFSRPDYIWNSIINSELSKLLSLENINVKECNDFASSSIALKAKELFDCGNSIKQISKQFQIHEETVRKYINNFKSVS